jgi:hypothetical protein
VTFRELLEDATDMALRSEAYPNRVVDEHQHRPLASFRLGMRETVEGSESWCIDCWSWIRFDGRLWIIEVSREQMVDRLRDMAR